MQKFLPPLYWFSPTALPGSYILITPLTFLLIVLYVCEIGPLFPKEKDLSKKQKKKGLIILLSIFQRYINKFLIK